MHNIHIHKINQGDSILSHCTVIEKNEKMKFVLLCHANKSSVADIIFRICTDQIVDFSLTETDEVRAFTEILDRINHALDKQYHLHDKKDISIFLWLLVDKQIHFSMFGSKISGLMVSDTNIEDILVEMDTGEWHFVYDSHGEIHAHETLYLFAPRIDTHVLGDDCKTLWHLSLPEKTEFLWKRLEKTYLDDAIIMGIWEENTKSESSKNWNRQSLSNNFFSVTFFKNILKLSNHWSKKIQASFYKLSHEAQNWSIIAGIFMSTILLYLVITTLVKGQYKLFVPQKYRDILAEARSDLDNATRLVDQPENFWPALSKIREKILAIKVADVLKIDVAILEKEMGALEKTINKVTPLKPEDAVLIYEFSRPVDLLPFSLYAHEDKVTLMTTDTIIGPFWMWEVAKENVIPGNEKFLFSDIDNEWKIYFTTQQNKIFIFNKWIFSLQNIQQVGGWDRAGNISVYNGNIYLLSENRKQIFKHRRQSENTYAGKSLVITDNQDKSIIDLDIDGSVWILWGKADFFSTEKILTAPKYERRPIIINGLGINTIKDTNPETFKVYASDSYQEVYLLADNRIWVFIPNSKRFNDVFNITYVWQIDVGDKKITDIAIEQNGDVRKIYFWSSKSGVYMTKITIKDNKIMVLPSK